jgi:ABC-type Fe3+/spermidine/putrescine transport system ATPase subunit
MKDIKFVVPQAKLLATDKITLSIRPEKIEIVNSDKLLHDMEPSNILKGKIEVFTFLGAVVRMLVDSANGEIIVDIVEKEFEQRQLNRGDEVDMYFPPDAFTVYQKD